MRKIKTAYGECYHILNRGNNKQKIFLDERDWTRFLFLILYFQSPKTFSNIGRHISHYVQHSVFNISKDITKEISANQYIKLVNFALMPNHFHLTILEQTESGTAQYMQRVLNSYTKYFNIKYSKTGHVFQGPYQIVHVEDNPQLLHLSAYIHRNPIEIKGWKNKIDTYPWSSYQDYIYTNRWGNLLQHQIITDQFATSADYQDFISTSPAKTETKFD